MTQEKIHLAMCVSDLQKSREYYQNLFQTEPQKETHDQIDWILNSPPIHFSIYISDSYPVGLEHFGFVFGQEKLEEIKDKLKCENGVVFDTDGHKIELYTQEQ